MHSEPIYWLLGLPFDAVGMDAAVQRIREAARDRRRLVVITPNVNFVAMAAGDPAFRDALLHSHLSLVDGMPLVWLGRRNRIPFPERVAGSSLLVRLAAESAAPPLRVHFFGGESGAAERAAARLTEFGGGLASAGWTDPGFVPVESMGSPALLERINASDADLLVLALGAKKGHEWITRHQHAINVPVISHLGATVNFIAGTVERAPRWVQDSGLEWIWRTVQEPRLARRYFGDGLALLRLLVQRAASTETSQPPTGERALAAARAALEAPGAQREIDVADVGPLDARTLGVLYAWRHRLPGCERHRLLCSSAEALAQLKRLRADCLLTDAGGATPGAQ